MPNSQIESSDLQVLWRQFRFPGQPPKAGSVAEQRLRDACENYVNIITAKQRAMTVPMEEDGENYRRPDDDRPSYYEQRTASSDESRRNLHNQIAVMVYGQVRSEMDSATAEKLADFACQFAAGTSIDQL